MYTELDKKVEALAKELFKDGKDPSETFGFNWEMLSKLEKDVPELTCRQTHNQCQSA